MYALRSRTPHAHELSVQRLNQTSQLHGDPTSPGSLTGRAKSGGTRLQAKHAILAQQLVALWNRRGLTLHERQQQVGSSRVLTHPTEENIHALQKLIQDADFSSHPRGGAPRPESSRGHEALMEEVFKPIRLGQHPTEGSGGAYVRSGSSPVQSLTATPILSMDSPNRRPISATGSRPISRQLNYSVGYNDSIGSAFSTPAITPSKESEAKLSAAQEQKLELNSSSVVDQQERSKPSLHQTKADASSDGLSHEQCRPLVESEGVHRTMISDDALSQIDIMYLTHCHAQMSIESQILDNERGAPDAEMGRTVTKSIAGGSSVHSPSFIYERTSQSVLLEGLPGEKMDRLFLLEQCHRVKLERVALLGPSALWDLFIVGRTETTRRSLIEQEYKIWSNDTYAQFGGFLNKYLDAKPLYRLAYTAFYRVEQEENAGWVFLSDRHAHKKAVIERCQPVFTCERDDREMHSDLEEAEREELAKEYEDHFSVALRLQDAREECELDTINQDEDYVRAYQLCEESYARQILQLQQVEEVVRSRMSNICGKHHDVLVKTENVLVVVEEAKTQLRELSEQTSLSTEACDHRIKLELSESFEIRELNERMAVMVSEAIERCLIYLQLREARDRLQISTVQELELVEMDWDNVHRSLLHDEDALFQYIPQAVFLQFAHELENAEDSASVRLMEEEHQAFHQIPVDLCVQQLMALEEKELEDRGKIEVNEEDDREEAAIEESGAGCIVVSAVGALAAQTQLYAALVIQGFARKLIRRARRRHQQQLEIVEALQQEQGEAANIVQRCAQRFKARLHRRRVLVEEAARRHQESLEQEQLYAADSIANKSRNFLQRHEAKKIVAVKRADRERSEQLKQVNTVAEAIHNEAHLRHEIMMDQISTYMELSEKKLSDRSALMTGAIPSRLKSLHPDNQREEAAQRIQSAGRNRRAKEDAEERRSRSRGESPTQPQQLRDEPSSSKLEEKHVAARKIQSAGRHRRALEDVEGRRSRSSSPSNAPKPDLEPATQREMAVSRIQSAGRHRKAIADVEARRSRSNSPACGVSREAAPEELPSQEDKEIAVTRLQSAGRHRKAIADVNERRSRSSSPA